MFLKVNVVQHLYTPWFSASSVFVYFRIVSEDGNDRRGTNGGFTFTIFSYNKKTLIYKISNGIMIMEC